jgi:hypothetical protein
MAAAEVVVKPLEIPLEMVGLVVVLVVMAGLVQAIHLARLHHRVVMVEHLLLEVVVVGAAQVELGAMEAPLLPQEMVAQERHLLFLAHLLLVLVAVVAVRMSLVELEPEERAVQEAVEMEAKTERHLLLEL